jgi:hypothetical protein
MVPVLKKLTANARSLSGGAHRFHAAGIVAAFAGARPITHRTQRETGARETMQAGGDGPLFGGSGVLADILTHWPTSRIG